MTILIVVILVVLSGLFSGFTLGLMSLNAHELRRKALLGDVAARKVYRVRKDGNLLLVTLLLGNVAVNAALSIFLGSLTAGIVAGLIATGLIVIFGEIIPQAIFARHGLVLGARLVWLVNIFLFLLFPIARPMASILDRMLGSELQTIYSRQELLKIIEDHKYSSDSDVEEDEEKIIRGALTFSSKSAAEVMTPLADVYMLEKHALLSDKQLHDIREHAWSRIPVFKKKRDAVVGVIRAKNLIGRDLEECTAGDMMQDVLFVRDRKPLDDVFELFMRTRQHLAVVTNSARGAVGVVTFEDVIEEIIREEIEDESDT